MSSSPEYVFTRDYLDNNRINLQHYLVVQLFGYRIHPSIPVKDVNNLRIADVGTGTGIWLTDLADEFPSTVQLDGLDISFDAAPPRDWLPPNMSLHHWDIKAEVPEHLVGVYDVVNVRHFVFVLQQSDLKGVLDNLFKLLKPGGYLQWTDFDMSSLRVEKINPDIKADANVKLMELFQANDTRLRSAWGASLPSLFAQSGFNKVESDVKDAPPHLAVALHECGMLATEVLARNKAGGNEQMVQQLRQTLAEAAKETREGSVLAFTRLTVVGQKPSQ
ncbi:hypothetical protein ALT_8232 [Aspergillus lentulus]|uniref:Methyltransferase domain-containing protein n=1 Tax=Aspergillus lentulus TaxID=293939 RepID=A0AAN4TDU1_ASPLE|nr:hypothetical protein CNMCM6069_007053 [Aspergillus lentulus]KAF4165787.1 hypothetical protein CNMCM6936_007406 [Aspergillus lentulus]KAF4174802.1 hypothetical protein CNMCM8060_008112 [Aspergillus lentulus]KAF4184339.1 hypothetical protein CNMCM7927_008149 [Aspergillus lentulus]KAF4193832.1 hypothetical protein CNMCM8694_008341 [Aspergillus lentulus]